MADNPDMEGLREFIERGDREDALFFVGRTELLSKISRGCQRGIEKVRKGEVLKGATHLIQGAPGAGKTAMLSELKKRWKEQGEETPIVVEFKTQELASEANIVTAIAETVKPKLGKAWRTQLTSNISGGISAGASGSIKVVAARGEISANYGRGRVTNPESINFRALRNAFPPDEWKRPICLLVDEIQSIWQPDISGIMSGVADVLRSLHQDGGGLPIVPVYAGLGDSYEVLTEANLTRLDPGNVFNVGALAEEEAADAVVGMLKRFSNFKEGNMFGWPRFLAVRSEGWPQHLHNGMRALAEGLEAADRRLEDVDVAQVLTDEKKFRTESYVRRISPAIKSATHLVADLLNTMPDEGWEQHEIESHIIRYGRSNGDDDPAAAGWRLPYVEENKAADHEVFFRILKHQGIIQTDENDLHPCPIPSLKTHILMSRGLLDKKEVDAKLHEQLKLLEYPKILEHQKLLEPPKAEVRRKEPVSTRNTGRDRGGGRGGLSMC